MRIVIDMQGAQAESRFRGIGRYTMSFAQAVVRNRGEHEVILALNGLFPDTIEPIRAAFDGLLPQENIRVWHAPGPVRGENPGNEFRREVAELLREAFLSSLQPDVVHISSLFEGYVDDAVTSIGRFDRATPVTVTLYDLIPPLDPDHHLKPNPSYVQYCQRKIEDLKRAAAFLAISESARQESVAHLGVSEEKAVNVSTAVEPHFQPHSLEESTACQLRGKYGIRRPFVLCTGGSDERKYLPRLIEAYAALPSTLRDGHQLVFAGRMAEGEIAQFRQLGKFVGFKADELLFTDYVSEEELVHLYNLCKLFVFPSWHEGFGLPALEAMRCGAPVIGANTSSLPEVIGWDEALFDPRSSDAIAAAIERALSDEAFRVELIRHGGGQAEKSSWDESARRAIGAMERFCAERQVTSQPSGRERRPRLAYVSPLPPEKSGIADYSAELLPELSRFYEIDVIVSQEAVSDSWVKTNCPVRSVQWFTENTACYERVLYHFGNSVFHQHMFGLLKEIPGVVVLHDFFLAHIVHHMDAAGLAPDSLAAELYQSHGYPALYDLSHVQNAAEIAWKYPCSLSVIQDSLGMIAHSPNSLRLVEEWYGGELSDWVVVPLVRDSRICGDKISARKTLGFGEGDFLVCAFGILGPTKLNHRLLQAWMSSRLARDPACHLVFVGENGPGDYGRELIASIRDSGTEMNIRITGWADVNAYRRYLAAADIGVQLRTLSRGETSAAVLDCMNHGLATIVNANGSMADLDETAVWKLPDEFADGQLVDALETLWRDAARRRALGQAARENILRDHNPRACAEQYSDAIERFYRSAASGVQALPAAIASLEANKFDKAELIPLADAIARSFPLRNQARQLLVDVSALVHEDLKTGIQRVVRSVLREWLRNPPAGLRIEPVYATTDEPGYRYARRFTLGFLECPDDLLEDEPIEYAAGDVFVGLDLHQHVIIAQQAFYQQMRQQGLTVKFVVYDLLPVLLPRTFPLGTEEGHREWLNVVAQSDGAICISRAVADELDDWMRANAPARREKFTVDAFHLGADMENSSPSRGVPRDAEATLRSLQARPSFLLVGTIEPRKGHAQVLAAFEQSWHSGADVNLVIVGKQGWLVENLVERLRRHAELGERLFWFEGVSDEYLEEIYAASTCLIAASYGEGFGLPLIEAAQHKLPIIARDIPVFREVAGEHAFYFSGESPEGLAAALSEWVRRYASGTYPTSDALPWLTWKESATQLLSAVLGPAHKRGTVGHATVFGRSGESGGSAENTAGTIEEKSRGHSNRSQADKHLAVCRGDGDF